MARTEARTAPSTALPRGRPLWRRAPVRLVRHPALFAALGLGAMLVTVTAAAYPLFVSAAEGELIASTIATPLYTRYGAGITYSSTSVSFHDVGPDGGSLTRERRQAFTSAVAENPALDSVVESMAAPAVEVTSPGGRAPATGPVDGRLFAGTDVLDHVRILSGSDGDGVWLPDFIADPLRAGPGDTVELHDGADVVSVTVDGVYAALYSQPRAGYWQTWSDDIYQTCPDCALPPQFILSTKPQLIDLQTRLHDAKADQAWAAPVRVDPPLSLDQARSLLSFAADLQDRMQPRSTMFGSLFQCCGRIFQGFGTTDTMFHSAISDVVTIVEQRSAAVRGPAFVLLIAGLAISFVVVAAAALFSFASRPVETGILGARGWGPLGVGSKTALESAPPVLTGALGGFVLAEALVLGFGPDGPVEPAARSSAILSSTAATLTAVLLVGIVTATAFAFSHEHKGWIARVLTWVPWEVPAFAVALTLGRTLRSEGAIQAGQVQRPSAAIFLYPLTLALAVGILAARVVAVAVIRRARARGGGGVSAVWLASRRLAHSIRLTMFLLVAASLSVSVFVSAQALVESLRTTVDAKAKIFVGSDVEVQVVTGATPPTSFPLPVTQVQRALDAGSFDGDPQQPFDLLLVDPATFASAAFWNHGLSDDSLDVLMSRLVDRRDGVVPIVVANGAGYGPTSVTLGRNDAPVDVVGRAEGFPGAASLRPIVVMSRDALEPAFDESPDTLYSANSTTELWIRGPTSEALAAVSRSHVLPFVVITAEEINDIPLFVAAINTFLVLDVLGLVALLLVVVLAVVYLQARQRSRVVASALSERMGISRSTLRRALVVELGATLLGAVVIGGAAGIWAAPVVVDSIDPLPTIPPGPISVMPWIAVLVGAVMLLAAAVGGGWLADRATRRIPLGEVMRGAE